MVKRIRNNVSAISITLHIIRPLHAPRIRPLSSEDTLKNLALVQDLQKGIVMSKSFIDSADFVWFRLLLASTEDPN